MQHKDIDSGTLSLSCDECLLEDEGVYSCTVTRRGVSTTKKFIVFIQDPPTIEDAPRDHVVDLNADMLVTCIVRYNVSHLQNDELKVQWFKDWRALTTTHRTNLTLTTSERGSSPSVQHVAVLKIERCLLSDAGLYAVRITGKGGQCQSTFNVTVAEGVRFSSVKVRKTDFHQNYFNLGPVGSGRFSQVNLVVERSTGNEMVAKIYSMESVKHQNIACKELQCLRLLQYHSLPRLHDLIVDGSELAIIMEPVLGDHLLDYIMKAQDVDDRLLSDLFHQLCEAVYHLHSRKVAHLDLQPDNIIIVKRPNCAQVKVVGLSAAIICEKNQMVSPRLWNPEFSSPEVLNKGEIDLVADMWSVGVLAFILLSGGVHPFISGDVSLEDYTVTEMETQELEKNVSFSAMPENGRLFVRDCLHFHPEDRLTSQEAVKHNWFIDYKDGDQSEKSGSVVLLQDHLETYSTTYRQRAIYVENSADLAEASLSLHEYLEQIEAPIIEANGHAVEDKSNEVSSNDVFIDEVLSEELSWNGLVFQQPLRNESFQVGEDIQLVCQLAPHCEAVTVLWHRNQELLAPCDRVHMDVLPANVYCLTLRNSTADDAGVYQCVVRGKSSVAQTDAIVESKETPSTPGRPYVLQCGSTEVLICWPYRGSDLDGVVFRVDTLCVQKNCVESGDWRIAAYCVDSRCLLSDLQPDCQYRFRVCARNLCGISDYSIGSSAVYTDSTKTLVMDSEEHNYFMQRQTPSLGDLLNKTSLLRAATLGSAELSEEEIQTAYQKERDLSSKVALLTCHVPTASRATHIVLKSIPEDEEQELEILEQLKSIHVTRLLGSFMESNNICLALEYAAGGHLLTVLRHRESYSEFLVSEVAKQILHALLYVHHQGFLHGDVRLENILVSNRSFSIPSIKLCCFHSANYLNKEMIHGQSEATKDICSVSACMFHLLSGQPYQSSQHEANVNALLGHCSIHARHFIQHSVLPQQSLHEKQLLKHKWFSLETRHIQERCSVTLLSDRLMKFPV